METSNIDLSLSVQNNRNYPIDMNIMGNNANALDTSNSYTEYRYDMTAFTFSTEQTVKILYKPVGAAVFSSFTTPLQSQTLSAIVIALNELQIGYFNLYAELGNTYIGTNNDSYVFSDLEVYDNSAPPSNISVDVYAMQDVLVVGRRVWWSTDNFATVQNMMATPVTAVGTFMGTISVPSGTNLYFAIGDTISIADGATATSHKVSTPNDYPALPTICFYPQHIVAVVSETVNLLANSSGFDMACFV